MSCLRFNSLSFSRSMFESVAFESFGYDHIQSSWLRKVSVWISKYFGYFYFIHLIRLFFFNHSCICWISSLFANAHVPILIHALLVSESFQLWPNLTLLSFRGSVFQSASPWIMTEIVSSLIQQISIWISKSLGYDWDWLFFNSAAQYLNQWILRSWLWFAAEDFSRSLIESVNLLMINDIHSSLLQCLIRFWNESVDWLE